MKSVKNTQMFLNKLKRYRLRLRFSIIVFSILIFTFYGNNIYASGAVGFSSTNVPFNHYVTPFLGHFSSTNETVKYNANKQKSAFHSSFMKSPTKFLKKLQFRKIRVTQENLSSLSTFSGKKVPMDNNESKSNELSLANASDDEQHDPDCTGLTSQSNYESTDTSHLKSESVHLKLQSRSMLEKSNNKSEQENQPSEKSSEAKKSSTLITYHDPDRNITFSALDIPMRKFKLWLSETIFESQITEDSIGLYSALASTHENGFNPNFISTEEIHNFDSTVRTELRRLWHARQLLTDRTEVLSFYPSDRGSQKESDKNPHSSSTNNINNVAGDGSKRGGFSDLLTVHAERLLAIIQDENEEKSHGENLLVEWIETNYGMYETQELKAEKFLARPESIQFLILQKFLDWFRQKFPYYYDRCDQCGASAREDESSQREKNEVNIDDQSNLIADNTINMLERTDFLEIEEDFNEDEEYDNTGTFLGYVYPSEDELKGKATRTEIYCCHKCGSFTRFPRYNSASSVLQNHKGRCGEYSMLLYRFLRALGHDTRWVVDWSDHVWAEIYLSGRWIHLDPCEAAVDKPLLYEEWGKTQTYIIAFHAPIARKRIPANGIEGLTNGFSAPKIDLQKGAELPMTEVPFVEDVTNRYTSDSNTEIHGRREESNKFIQRTLEVVQQRIRDHFARSIESL